LNYAEEKAFAELASLSGKIFNKFKPVLSGKVDPMLYKLSNGFLFNKKEIEQTEVFEAYEWYYLMRGKELNELLVTIDDIKKMQEK